MKELLETIAKALVQFREVCLTLAVNEQDMGKVIGRGGRIAKAIRSVMNAAASKQNKRISIDIQ